MAESKAVKLIQQAQHFLAKKDAQQALVLGQKVLSEYPSSLDALLTLAIGHQQLNQNSEAFKYINQVIKNAPTLEMAHLTRLQIAKQLNHSVSLLDLCKSSLSASPNSSQLWYELSQIEYGCGNKLLADQAFKKHLVLSASTPSLKRAIKAFFDQDFVESEKEVRQHLLKNPNDVSAIRLLGELALTLGVFEDAQRLFERALQLAPKYNLARLNYAHVLNKRELSKAALEQVNFLEQHQPDHAPIISIKAAVLVKLGQYQEAIALYQKLLLKQPNQPEVWASLGHTYKTLGDKTRSVESYLAALEHNPDYGDAYWSLANLKTYQFTPQQITNMKRSYNKLKTRETENLAQICFALGKAYEGLQNVDSAFKYYQLGNQIKGTLEPYLKDEIEQLVARNKAFFHLSAPASSHNKNANTTPIFIVGLPRSGSTLLEQILASHSQVDGTKELADIIALARKLGNRKRKLDTDNYPESLGSLSSQQKLELGAKYIDSSKHLRNGAPFFIDKMPNNFLHIGLIKAILPQARIIDARRMPASSGFSCYKQLFATGQNFSYDLNHIEHYYLNYLDLMAHWKSIYPDDILTVHYEDVVEDTEQQVRNILKFLNLDFEENCLHFYNNTRAVATASAEQVRQPINSKGLDAWRPFTPYIQNLIAIS